MRFTTICSRSRIFQLTLALNVMAATSQMVQAQPVTGNVAAVANTDTVAVLARGPYDTMVTVNDVMAELQRAPRETRKNFLDKPDSVQQMVNSLLVRRALAVEAKRDGLTTDPIVVAATHIAQDRVASDARLAKLDQQNEPSAAALDAYARNQYKANAARFDVPAQSRARHILLKNEGPASLQKAKDLLAQLRAGASFEELAKAHSIDPGSAAKGGDLGFFGAGKMVRPFEDAVNALAKPGDLSEPVESQFGYHIIRLEERRDKGRQPYEEVKAQLTEEARIAMLNDLRVTKVQSLNQDVTYDRAAIEALGQKPAQ